MLPVAPLRTRLSMARADTCCGTTVRCGANAIRCSCAVESNTNEVMSSTAQEGGDTDEGNDETQRKSSVLHVPPCVSMAHRSTCSDGVRVLSTSSDVSHNGALYHGRTHEYITGEKPEPGKVFCFLCRTRRHQRWAENMHQGWE